MNPSMVAMTSRSIASTIPGGSWSMKASMSMSPMIPGASRVIIPPKAARPTAMTSEASTRCSASNRVVSNIAGLRGVLVGVAGVDPLDGRLHVLAVEAHEDVFQGCLLDAQIEQVVLEESPEQRFVGPGVGERDRRRLA